MFTIRYLTFKNYGDIIKANQKEHAENEEKRAVPTSEKYLVTYPKEG